MQGSGLTLPQGHLQPGFALLELIPTLGWSSAKGKCLSSFPAHKTPMVVHPHDDAATGMSLSHGANWLKSSRVPAPEGGRLLRDTVWGLLAPPCCCVLVFILCLHPSGKCQPSEPHTASSLS